MGFKKRLLNLVVPVGPVLIPVVKNVTKHGVKDGLSEAQKEIERDHNEMLKKSVFFRQAYDLGQHEGQKQGYIDASVIFEQKLKNQALEFLSKEQSVLTNLNELETLLEGMETYIEYLTQKKKLTDQENQNLKEALVLERRLKQI
ncbi:hypothetical protein [Exiguobacterium sp. s57]|uniref:hypothetical protein n=1 Tax=Exiguobacterium sp. s57 TaxID=2751258 RepID=UPI001BEAD3B2|nr:hypothetical protein [Exiguobacterium sp. s57]